MKDKIRPNINSNVKVTLVEIVDRVLIIYNTNERWVLKKMKSKYANKIVAILPIIYKKDRM
jgi:hypothetical protein